MNHPGWLEPRLDAAIDRLLMRNGLQAGLAEAEARAHRLSELNLEPFAAIWTEVARELRKRIDRGLDA